MVGATPFLLAAATYDTSTMRTLVAGGADPLLATNTNTTPLMMAAGLAEGLGSWVQASLPQPRTEEYDRRALEAVKLTVELGADVNAANDIGLTALHGAAYVGSDRVIQFLVDKGAKVNVEDKYGRTPLSIVQKINAPRMPDNYLRGGFHNKSTADLLGKLGATLPTVPTAQLSDVATQP